MCRDWARDGPVHRRRLRLWTAGRLVDGRRRQLAALDPLPDDEDEDEDEDDEAAGAAGVDVLEEEPSLEPEVEEEPSFDDDEAVSEAEADLRLSVR